MLFLVLFVRPCASIKIISKNVKRFKINVYGLLNVKKKWPQTVITTLALENDSVKEISSNPL